MKTLKPIKFYIIYIYIYVRTRFASQAKWFGQWPNEPKTMNLLESGPDIERSMSQDDADHNRLVSTEINETNSLNKKVILGQV